MKNPYTSIFLVLLVLLVSVLVAGWSHATRLATRQVVTHPSIAAQATPNQPALVLLPTVTPTPVDHSPLGSPTRSPSILTPAPVPSPVVYPQFEVTNQGISDFVQQSVTTVMQSNAGYGKMYFNRISPCLCQTELNWHACGRRIEAYQLSAPVPGIVREDGCLSIALGDGRLALFTNVSNTGSSVSYTFEEAWPEIDYFLVHAWLWEGDAYLLVDGESGAITVLSGYPLLSPDKEEFVIIRPAPVHCGCVYISMWQMGAQGPLFDRGWQVLWEEYTAIMVRRLAQVAWEGNDRVRMEWAAHEGLPPIEDVTLIRESDGWQVRYGAAPMVQPMVEPRSIDLAPASADDLLGVLAVGQPVYTDQDYVFTRVPPELAGQTYFRLQQHYYLGEEPDYFPEAYQRRNYLEFQVTGRAHVYVGLDAQLAQRPDWMDDSWRAVDLQLVTNDIPLQLYRKTYAAGETVGLVSQWLLPDRVPSQFVVVVTPAD